MDTERDIARDQFLTECAKKIEEGVMGTISVGGPIQAWGEFNKLISIQGLTTDEATFIFKQVIVHLMNQKLNRDEIKAIVDDVFYHQFEIEHPLKQDFFSFD